MVARVCFILNAMRVPMTPMALSLAKRYEVTERAASQTTTSTVLRPITVRAEDHPYKWEYPRWNRGIIASQPSNEYDTILSPISVMEAKSRLPRKIVEYNENVSPYYDDQTDPTPDPSTDGKYSDGGSRGYQPYYNSENDYNAPYLSSYKNPSDYYTPSSYYAPKSESLAKTYTASYSYKPPPPFTTSYDDEPRSRSKKTGPSLFDKDDDDEDFTSSIDFNKSFFDGDEDEDFEGSKGRSPFQDDSDEPYKILTERRGPVEYPQTDDDGYEGNSPKTYSLGATGDGRRKKRCVKKKKEMSGDEEGFEEERGKKMTCMVCDNGSGGTYEECSYESEPKRSNYVTSYRKSGSSESPHRYRRRADSGKEMVKLVRSVYSDDDKYDPEEDFDSGAEYGMSENEDDIEEEEREPSEDDYKPKPPSYADENSCEEVKKGGETCMVCINPETNGKYEQCSYSTDPDENTYEYERSASYAKKEPKVYERYRRHETTNPAEPVFSHKYAAAIRRENFLLPTSSEKSSLFESLFEEPTEGTSFQAKFNKAKRSFGTHFEKPSDSLTSLFAKDGDGEEERDFFSENLAPSDWSLRSFRSKKETSNPFEKSILQSKFADLFSKKSNSAESGVFGKEDRENSLVGKIRRTTGSSVLSGDDDDDTFSRPLSRIEDSSSITDLESFPVKNLLEKDSGEDGELSQMMRDFKDKDRSACKKIIKDKMTCYECKDKNGKREECMYVNDSEPEQKRQVSYHERNGLQAPSESKVAVVTSSIKNKQPQVEKVAVQEQNIASNATNAHSRKRARKPYSRKIHRTRGKYATSLTTTTTPLSEADSKPEGSENEEKFEGEYEHLGDFKPEVDSSEPEGAHSSETQQAYHSVLKFSLPKYMLEKSDQEKDFDETLRSAS